jgi:hypothetical protein
MPRREIGEVFVQTMDPFPEVLKIIRSDAGLKNFKEIRLKVRLHVLDEPPHQMFLEVIKPFLKTLGLYATGCPSRGRPTLVA